MFVWRERRIASGPAGFDNSIGTDFQDFDTSDPTTLVRELPIHPKVGNCLPRENGQAIPVNPIALRRDLQRLDCNLRSGTLPPAMNLTHNHDQHADINTGDFPIFFMRSRHVSRSASDPLLCSVDGESARRLFSLERHG